MSILSFTRSFRLIVIFSVSIVIAINSLAQVDQKLSDTTIAQLKKFIEKEMKKNKVAAVSIAVVDDQNILWADGFGYADKANKVKATSKTIYRVGSVSKLFTSLSVMQLAEQHKLNIDEPIKKYIPEFAIKNRFVKSDITPRTVMMHHSGLPSDIFKGFFTEHPEPFTSIIGYLNEEYTCSPSNLIFSYSNVGYDLLGCLIERVSGNNFIDYTDKNVLAPIGMKNSSFRLSNDMEKLYAKGYAKGKEFIEPDIRDLPAGMLHSNVLDLSEFMKMTFHDGKAGDRQIIASETLKEMQEKQNVNVPLDMNFSIGLCWFLSMTGVDWSYAGSVAEHGGDTYVYHAELLTLPSQKIGVVILTNTDRGASILKKITKKVMEETLTERRKINPPKEKDGKLKLLKSNDPELKKYEGSYALGTEPLEIKALKNKLVTRQNGLKLFFIPNNQGYFTPRVKIAGFPITVKDQQIKFIKVDTMDIMLFRKQKDSVAVGIKIKKIPLTDLWKQRAGDYKVLNDSSKLAFVKNFKIVNEDGFLKVKFSSGLGGKVSAALRPINDNEAVVEGIGRETGFTLSFKEDEIYFSGLKLKKLEKKHSKK